MHRRTTGLEKFAIALALVAIVMLLNACAGTAKGLGEFIGGIGVDIQSFAKGSTETQAKEYEKQKEYEEYLVSTGRLPR